MTENKHMGPSIPSKCQELPPITSVTTANEPDLTGNEGAALGGIEKPVVMEIGGPKLESLVENQSSEQMRSQMISGDKTSDEPRACKPDEGSAEDVLKNPDVKPEECAQPTKSPTPDEEKAEMKEVVMNDTINAVSKSVTPGASTQPPLQADEEMQIEESLIANEDMDEETNKRKIAVEFPVDSEEDDGLVPSLSLNLSQELPSQSSQEEPPLKKSASVDISHIFTEQLEATEPAQKASLEQDKKAEVEEMEEVEEKPKLRMKYSCEAFRKQLDLIPTLSTPELTPQPSLEIEDSGYLPMVNEYAEQPWERPDDWEPEGDSEEDSTLPPTFDESVAEYESNLPPTVVKIQPDVQQADPETQFEFSHYSYSQSHLGDEIENPDTQERNDLISDYRLLQANEEESDTEDLIEDLLADEMKQSLANDRLSADNWSVVFQFVDVRDRLTWHRVSKRWRSILQAPRVWKHIGLLRSGQKMTDDRLAEFVCDSWNACTKLDLGHAHKLTNEALAHIGEACSKLRKLHIAHAPRIDSKGILSILACKRLTHISLIACDNVDDDCLRYLARMKRLLEIDVSFCPKVTSTAVKHLAEGKTTFTLIGLNLFHTGFTNEGCKSLTYLQRLETLKVQNVETTGLNHIKTLSSLRILALLRSKLKESSVLSLLKAPTSLVTLSLTDCLPLTSKTRRKFERARITLAAGS